MLKKSMMVASILTTLGIGTGAAVGANAKPLAVRDAQIIVEVDRSNETLTKEGIQNTQDRVLSNIRNYATSNIEVLSRYSEVANAFAISVNTEDIELIKKVPGVKSVTLNEIHWETRTVSSADGAVPCSEGGSTGEYGGNENVSAETMNKPEGTNDGEGTTIAILDNEFFLRGRTNTSEAWNHEVFTALDDSVAVKHKGRPSGFANTRAGKKANSTVLGKEGSCYFNNKVPYYFDYGGEKTYYGQDPSEDFDVSSEISYHGSHVASIAAANAPDYKGIAPKAQLICMKVFTNFNATGIDKLLGFSTSSGAYDMPIMNALEDCMTLKVDGINMSLGSNLDDFDSNSITLKVLNKLIDSGIMTSISAGNSGKSAYSSTGAYSNWTKDMVETGILSSYANQANAMTIAAGQPNRIFYENGFKMGEATIAYDDQIVNREGWDAEYTKEYKTADLGDHLEWQYIPGFGTAADYSGLDVQGKLAVVNRGSTSFADKYNIAKSQGAIGIVIINNDPTSNDFNFRCSFGDGFKPTMPCCLVLYKDKGYFEDKKSGTIDIITKEVVENPYTKTVSSFSTDGATFDLDLKPDITAPGENIRGAVPPQKTEDRGEERRYKVYEYLSGTSMSAPNYAGVQSLMLSKVSAPIYQKYISKGSPTKSELAEIADYRSTVDMRLMSTAVPMKDIKECPEDGVINLTSPRKQGAGMVDIEKAYNTDVYFEGLDAQGNPTGKSKIALRNNADINSGNIILSFLTHNESNENRNYKVKLTVMRPAVASTQDIVTKDYVDMGEIDKIENLPGKSYWVRQGLGEHEQIVERVGQGSFNHNEVYKVSKEIQYYASAEDCANDVLTTIPVGRYYNAGDSVNANWVDLPTYEYQSVYDSVIDVVDLQTLTVAPGDNLVTLNKYSLSAEAKARIAELYEYGCYIEGFVEFESTDGHVDLSMPYLGFYSSLNEQGGDFSSCPVVEPFSFEKDDTKVYPSQLVNDIAKALVGKDKCDMGSMMVTGYLAQDDQINSESILSNDSNLKLLSGWHEIGTDPITGEPYADAKNNLYCGSANYSNMLIVQQFVLRSVADNFFTITNKKTGEIVYKSVLEDMLFGDQMGKYPLYKSHVDDSYLGAGYIAHRAYAEIPLYNPDTGVSFPSGDYEITFNYLLAGTNSWVNKAYTLHIDSSAPEVSSVNASGDTVTVDIKEANLTSAVLNKSYVDFEKTGAESYRLTFTKDEIIDALRENFNEFRGSGRLFIGLTDKAFGKMGVVVRFNVDGMDPYSDEYDFSRYAMVEHHSLTYRNDFDDATFDIVEYDSATISEKDVVINDFVLKTNGAVNYGGTTSGCAGNITTTSITLSVIAFTACVVLVISKKRKDEKLGGNN